ncbi:MAG: helix-turn-helix transcriptional regulator [Erysipelothrix sp.]
MKCNILKGKIVASGYSQRSFADAMNVSKNTINSLLTGKRIPRVDEASKMCILLGIVDPVEKCFIFLDDTVPK